jgi:uncharacterized protein (TIGR02118 family)
MNVVRVCYKQGVRFDEAYYTAKHLPLAASVFGPLGLKSVEMVKMMAMPDGSKPPYQVMFSAYFESAAALQNAMQNPRMPEVIGDIPKFYDGMPDILIGEVASLPGKP